MAKQKSPQRTLVQEEILNSLKTTIRPTETGFGYRLGITAVGLAMLMMPLIYLGVIGLIGHMVWWNIEFAKHAKQGGLNIILAILGAITILFMIKPIFSGWQKGAKPIRLKRNAEPFLFDYVEAICDAVNAPYPKSIRIDCEPNASAGPRKSVLSLFQGELTLTIGMPLVAGFNVRQLTGVLGHEFGHFSQGYGMKLSAIVRRMNYWYMRAAFERDNWDEMLVSLSRSLPSRVAVFVWIVRFFVWLARKLIFFVFILGHAISSYMLREMEYDADRYETRLVGSKTFASTCKKLADITLANQMALNDLNNFYREGKLADNLPALIVSNIPHITPEIRKLVRKHERDTQTGWFDSHPTNRDRIESAKAENTDGVFNPPMNFGDLPASVLFHDFERVSKAITLQHYKALLAEDFDKSKVKSTEILIGQREAEIEAGKALDRYFQVHIPILRPLRLADDVNEPPENAKETLRELQESRKQMLALVDEYETLAKCIEEAEDSWLLAGEAQALLDANISFNASDYRLKSSRQKTVRARTTVTEEAVRNLGARMLPFEMAAEERLSYALRLLHVPKVSQAIKNGDELLQLQQLIPEAVFVSNLMNSLPDLRIAYRKLGTLCSHLDNHARPELIQAIETQMRSVHSILRKMKKKMSTRMYPFEHTVDSTKLDDYALPFVPDTQDLLGLLTVTQEMFERLAGVQMRLFSRLAHTAEKVEAVVGLPPLQERKPKETAQSA